MGRVHAVIPDVQVKPGQDYSFLGHIGNYLAEKKPDVIVQIGDFADMPSLSSYDYGKKSYEGRRYLEDVESVYSAMGRLMMPINLERLRLKRNKEKQWKPELHLTLGNHEDRITRLVNSDPKLEGFVSLDDLNYDCWGWKVHDYLKPVCIDGVHYAHFFTSGVMGRAVPNAKALVQRTLQSCVMGHVQHWDIHRQHRADGKGVIGLFSGSCYEHNEDYLGPQGNYYERGIWMLYEVEDGDFHPLHVSLSYLRKKYGELGSGRRPKK